MENNNIGVINFVSGINPKSISALMEFTVEIRNRGLEKIILNISSTGGELASIFGVYYHLRALGIPLEACNLGNVESSAVLLYLAADTRFAAPHSRFLFHNFNWTFGPDPVVHSIIREKLSNLDFDADRYRDIFNERTKGAECPINIDKALHGEAIITAAPAAITAGLCSAIKDPTVPAGAALWWIS